MRPCQGRDRGSTPLTRSKSERRPHRSAFCLVQREKGGRAGGPHSWKQSPGSTSCCFIATTNPSGMSRHPHLVSGVAYARSEVRFHASRPGSTSPRRPSMRRSNSRPTAHAATVPNSQRARRRTGFASAGRVTPVTLAVTSITNVVLRVTGGNRSNSCMALTLSSVRLTFKPGLGTVSRRSGGPTTHWTRMRHRAVGSMDALPPRFLRSAGPSYWSRSAMYRSPASPTEAGFFKCDVGCGAAPRPDRAAGRSASCRA